MLCSIYLIQEQIQIPKLLSDVKKAENPVESPNSCTEVHYSYNSNEPVSTNKEAPSCQHHSSAPPDALERRTPQAVVLTVALLK